MTIGAVVFTAIKAIPELGNRVYQDTFAQKDGGLPRRPAVRYQLVSAVNAETVCGTDDESTDDTRVQVDVIADSERERDELVPLIIGAMMNLDPPASRDGLRREFDEPTRTWRASFDFIFYPSSEETS